MIDIRPANLVVLQWLAPPASATNLAAARVKAG